MSKPVALVTGAGGEMGRLLIPSLEARGFDIAIVDLALPPQDVRSNCIEAVEASILNREIMADLFRRLRPSQVFHLAAVLSAKAERDPDLAHQVNVEGTLGLFKLCQELGASGGKPVRFLFPSSIAVYGLPDARTKNEHGAVKEWEWDVPTGMYGCNKVYCELYGSYISNRGLKEGRLDLDFRSIRFPGLVSADTLPTGGTTDYAPEMIHAAAKSEPYDCFVGKETRLPFMTMPDAVEALLTLAAAERDSLSTSVYNIKGFSASAGEIRGEVLKHFPEARIGFKPNPDKQALVDTWPADVDDRRARRDWDLNPEHDLARALGEYLLPALRKRYATESQT